MNPIRHTLNTRTLGAPIGWDQDGLPVEPLGVTDLDMGGVPGIMSLWELDDIERRDIADGAHVFLSVVGTSMPPVCLGVLTVLPVLTPAPATTLAEDLDALLERAHREHQVITVDLIPLEPYAMGSYSMCGSIRPGRVS